MNDLYSAKYFHIFKQNVPVSESRQFDRLRPRLRLLARCHDSGRLRLRLRLRFRTPDLYDIILRTTPPMSAANNTSTSGCHAAYQPEEFRTNRGNNCMQCLPSRWHEISRLQYVFFAPCRAGRLTTPTARRYQRLAVSAFESYSYSGNTSSHFTAICIVEADISCSRPSVGPVYFPPEEGAGRGMPHVIKSSRHAGGDKKGAIVFSGVADRSGSER